MFRFYFHMGIRNKKVNKVKIFQVWAAKGYFESRVSLEQTNAFANLLNVWLVRYKTLIHQIPFELKYVSYCNFTRKLKKIPHSSRLKYFLVTEK